MSLFGFSKKEAAPPVAPVAPPVAPVAPVAPPIAPVVSPVVPVAPVALDLPLTLNEDAMGSGVFGDDFKNLDGQALVDRLSGDYLKLSSKKRTALQIPSELSSSEERKTFYDAIRSVDNVVVLDGSDDFLRKIGVPESSLEYNLVDSVAGVADDDLQNARGLAGELQLTQGQFNLLVGEMASAREETLSADAASSERLRVARDNAISKIWGKDKESRLNGAELGAKHLANSLEGEWLADLKSSGALANPIILMALSSVGEGLLEKGMLVDSKVSYGDSVDELKLKIHEIRRDSDYYKQNVRSRSLRKKLMELTKLLA